jgi:hypothetical protein
MKNGVLLEMLVEFFQKLVSNKGTVISRRKTFRENGRVIAEVDVLLEGRFGSSEMSVAIECRDRKEPQGADWIQQIIGKRDTLRRFGIKHWIAVSERGFTQVASEMAYSAGIELLVPGDVQPVDPNAPGPHQLMKFQMNMRKWHPGTINASIGHESESILDQIEKDIAQYSWGTVHLGKTESDLQPLFDFLDPLAKDALKKLMKSETHSDFHAKTTLQFKDLYASIRGQIFQIPNLTVDINLQNMTLQPEFRMLTFINASLQRHFGIIGLNSFEVDGDTIHIMVAVKPGIPQQLIGVIRNGKGEPLSGETIQLPASIPGYTIGRTPKQLFEEQQK